MKRLLLFVLLSLAFIHQVEAGRWYIDFSGGDNLHSGASASEALATLQAAVDSAATGDTLLVLTLDNATGDTTNEEVSIAKSLSIWPVNDVDTLTAARSSAGLVLRAPGLSSDEVPLTVSGTGNTLSIWNTRAVGNDSSSSGFFATAGGAITSHNCAVFGGGDGGFYAFGDGSTITAINCTANNGGLGGFFANNFATLTASGCTATNSGNHGFFSRLNSTLTATHCTAVNEGRGGYFANSDGSLNATFCLADNSGFGGFYALSGSALTAKNCTASNGDYGGIYANDGANITAVDTIVRNSGLGVLVSDASQVSLTRVSVLHPLGNGISIEGLSRATLSNVTIFDASGDGVQAACDSVWVYDSIIAGCTGEGINGDSGVITISNNAIWDCAVDTSGITESGHLFTADPRFVAPWRQDFHLASHSPYLHRARDGSHLGAWPPVQGDPGIGYSTPWRQHPFAAPDWYR